MNRWARSKGFGKEQEMATGINPWTNSDQGLWIPQALCWESFWGQIQVKKKNAFKDEYSAMISGGQTQLSPQYVRNINKGVIKN